MRNSLFIGLFLFTPFWVLSQRIETKQLIKYTQGDGLTSYNVRKIVQDHKGFIWVATQDGLNRFDGHTFINYTKDRIIKYRISGVDIRDLIEDTVRHLLWVLPGEVGINAINTITGEVVLTQNIPFTSPEQWNLCMIRNREQLWIGTSTGIRIYDMVARKFIPSPDMPPRGISTTEFEVRSLLRDESGSIWVFYSGYGVVVYNGQTRKKIREITLSQLNDHIGNKDIRFYSCLLTGKGCILLATSQGLRKIWYDKEYTVNIDNAPCKSVPNLNTEGINCTNKDFNSEILVAGNNKLYRFDSSLTSYTVIKETPRIGESAWLSAVYSICNDRDNNIWLGCQEGLAFFSSQVSPFEVFSYDHNTNTRLSHVRSVCPVDNNTILAGLQSGIVTIDKLKGEYSQPYTGQLYHHIFVDRNKAIHVSRPDGMFIYQGKVMVPVNKVYPEFEAWAKIPINSHLILNDSLIVLGTESDNGILVWNTMTHRVRNIVYDGSTRYLASNIVNNIYQDTEHDIWVLSDNVITVLSPDFTRIRSISLTDKITGAPYGLYFDMCEARDNYWIAAYGAGIIQLDKQGNIKQVFNTKRGLSNDGVYQIYTIKNRQLLVTSNYGLSLIDLETNHCKRYYQKDGLHSNSFEEVSGMEDNGYIYAGGINGFTVINPLHFTSNTRPPILYFGSIRVETKTGIIDTMDVQLKKMIIPDNWLRTTIFFSGLNYFNSERVTYQYKISEIDSAWINTGTQYLVSLFGLSPGTYHLEVKAANEDDVWSSPIMLTLVFLPKWYQTWWFKTIIGLVVLGLLYGLYRYRLSQIKKEQQIRQRIASDLHDDIGSTLNSIKVFANLSLMKPESNTAYLVQLKEGVQSAIVGVRDMVWVLDDKQDTFSHLVQRVEQFISPLASAQGIDFEKSLDASLSDSILQKEEKRNLYLIIKEAFNNSVKYSGATSLQLQIKKTLYDKYAIVVRDNGKGFDISTIKNGNGLNNLRYRAAQIKYSIDISSSPGNGTTITLHKS